MPNYDLLHDNDLDTDEGVDAVAEELLDTVHSYLDEITDENDLHISTREWIRVQQAIIARLVQSIDADKTFLRLDEERKAALREADKRGPVNVYDA